jgi:photosystem II stability/assembly factor-like uncharacterized protein
MKSKNYLNFMLFSLLLLIPTISVGQLILKDTFMETTDVSNDGKVAGYEQQAGSYFIWNPDDQSTAEIGGAAPGNGIGGQATFSLDGTKLSGTSFTDVAISTDLERNILANYNYIFKSIQFPEYQNNFGYAAGQSSTSNGNGILLKTSTGGANWVAKWIDTNNHGLESMSFPSLYTGYVGGWNGYFAKTYDGGDYWEILDPANGTNVYIYNAISFKDDQNGVVAAQLDADVAAYYTSDGGVTWQTGTGLAGVVSKITYVEADTYFLVTNGGAVQKSNDNGATWVTVLNLPFTVLTEINFYNSQIGFATGEDVIYKTVNGGTTWTQITSPTYAIWRAIDWQSQNHLYIAGTPDYIYESLDGGTTWTWANQTLFNGGPALYDMQINSTAIHICGSQGNFYTKSLISSENVAQISIFDTNTDTWTPRGSLGFTVDGNRSAGYAISGDGNTVVGNSWANPVSGNGFTYFANSYAWNSTEGNVDMGSLFSSTSRSSRADAVSQDGSVAVGYQDFNGPWKSAVWRKNPAGGYFTNEYLLINPTGDPLDEFNQLGQCNTVSANGTWIGGEGDYAFANPWIWSQATGLIDLGNLGLTDVSGHVNSINNDGTRVVGYLLSNDFWSPVYTPFLWTPALGMVNLNDFVTTTLGYTLPAGGTITVPSAMSPNGEYIAGFGFIDDGNWGVLFNYRLQIPETLSVKSNQLNATTIFPNPTKGILNINTINDIDVKFHKVVYNNLFDKYF